MTACSMARFLKGLYREAGIAGASSHSGRRTLITRLAERGIDLKAIAEDRGPYVDPHDGHVMEANPTQLARILQDVTF
jgi:integrase/recombinase XerD